MPSQIILFQVYEQYCWFIASYNKGVFSSYTHAILTFALICSEKCCAKPVNMWASKALTRHHFSNKKCLFFTKSEAFQLNGFIESFSTFPSNIYLLKVNNRDTRKTCKICSNLMIRPPERRNWRRSGGFIVNFEHISHLFLVSLSMTLNN